MDDIHSRRTLALTGIFQAAGLVRETARRGPVPAGAAEASVASIFATRPESVEAVFGGIEGVRWGLQLLLEQLQGSRQGEPDTDLARYVIGLTVLEGKLSRRRGSLDALGAGIESARRSYDHFGAAHPNLLARLGELYTEHVSVLGSRILIRGDSQVLNEAGNVARVRAYLLAGLRAAVLWRQLGGRRRQLLLSRGRYLTAADHLLRRAVPS